MFVKLITKFRVIFSSAIFLFMFLSSDYPNLVRSF